MKLINFQIKEGIEIELAGQGFDLHNQFQLQRYTYEATNRLLELEFQSSVVWCGEFPEVDNCLTTNLKIIFKNVDFLRIRERTKDYPIDEQGECLDSIEFVDQIGSRNQEFFQMPNAPSEIEDCLYTDEAEQPESKNYLLISFMGGISILISAETAEVRFSQFI